MALGLLTSCRPTSPPPAEPLEDTAFARAIAPLWPQAGDPPEAGKRLCALMATPDGGPEKVQRELRADGLEPQDAWMVTAFSAAIYCPAQLEAVTDTLYAWCPGRSARNHVPPPCVSPVKDS